MTLPLLLLGVVATVVVAKARGRAAHRRREHAVELELPIALETAATALRAGASLRGALAVAASESRDALATDLGVLLAGAATGEQIPLRDALEQWGRTTTSGSVRLAAAALSLAAETGGAAARTLDSVAATLRDRQAMQREVRALATHARVSAVVLGLAPVGFTIVAALIDPRTAGFLLQSRAGHACLAAGLALDVVGLVWMRRLTQAIGT